MSDKKTPENNKAGGSRSIPSSAEERASLAGNSFDLASHETHTSNLRHGVIGGPAVSAAMQLGTHIRPSQSQRLSGQTDLARLTAMATGNERQLVSNQPRSWVTNLPSWRRGADNTTPPAVTGSQARDHGRPGASRAVQGKKDQTRLDRALEFQQQALREYQKPKPEEKQMVRYQVPKQQRDKRDESRFSRAVEYKQQLLLNYQGGERKKSKAEDMQLIRRPGPHQQQVTRGLDGGAREFRPMNAKLNPGEATRPLTEEEIVARKIKGISLNYHGDANNPANESADIPEWENCSVWIINLPPNCTYADLFHAIALHHPGKVWASHISKPSRESASHLPSHDHSAAKVIFYYPWSARHLIQVSTSRRFRVGNCLARVVSNRIRSAPQLIENDTSRVLEIQGPADIVNEPELRKLWKNQFDYDTEEVRFINQWVEFNTGETINRIVWYFGSHRAQAAVAFRFFMVHETFGQIVKVRYLPDPCDDQIPLL